MAIPGLRVRKLADRSVGERVTRYDPETGAAFLVNPETGEPENWPFAGLVVEQAPKQCEIPTVFVTGGVAEGWIELENPRMVHRPGGPPEEPWRVTHTFTHADAIVLKAVDGDVRYRVVEQPDKWPAEKNDEDEGFGGDVRHFYLAKLER